ncbi:hypothetical protein SAMN06296058_2742 [Pseudoxanthomonas indica]|uniref:Tetratricopeptide repeat-containing protein n=2 Tax=Pseudoxanthomonas indica TaxID=428993 RepID=A0A1T5LNG7_9GAMM|nr:hypothetical protein GCM10007235_06200 [Pseudoxanthomonas indica]SKC77028.1 hypothetical protein SAMN06296058_2742 [Pseudoxanthomonas indica]
MRVAEVAPAQVPLSSREPLTGTPSIPLQRLTFAAVGSTNDPIDRAIALPGSARASRAPETVQLALPSDYGNDSALAEAKRLLAAARPEDALRTLEPLLCEAPPHLEAWMVAGWAWWRLAQDNEGHTAFVQAGSAAQAFACVLEYEPDRADVMTRIARSHLLRSRHAPGDQMRRECLEQALACLAQRSQARADAPADLLELAQASLLRADASESGAIAEREHWLLKAQQHLAAIPATHPVTEDGSTRALTIDVQLGLAAAAKGGKSARLYVEAIEQLRLALATAGEGDKDAWLARMIDATRHLIQHQSGGSRLLTLQALQAEAAPRLQRTEAVAPLLAWIKLLDDWSRLLPARAAQAKLAEADRLFERASQLSPQAVSGIQFARAYYLRTRSRLEQGAIRLRTLQQAREILDGLPADALPASITRTEQAEVELALAKQADPDSASVHFLNAAAAAAEATSSDTHSTMAWHCAARALLGLSSLRPLDVKQRLWVETLASQLEEFASGQPEPLCTAARIRLSTGDYASSSRLCEAAWNAGALRPEVLPLWQEADARWARTLDHAHQHTHWQRSHQRLRLAGTSY